MKKSETGKMKTKCKSFTGRNSCLKDSYRFLNKGAKSYHHRFSSFMLFHGQIIVKIRYLNMGAKIYHHRFSSFMLWSNYR